MCTLRASIRGVGPLGGRLNHRGLTPSGCVLLACGLLTLAGCSDAHFLHKTCPQPADPVAAATAPAPDIRYRVEYPDVLEVAFTDHPEWDAFAAIDLDGRLPLDGPGRPRVEGLTLDEVRDELARSSGEPPDRVRVGLAAPRSRHVFVHGPVRGRTRVIPYQGPEPVIDFLKRVGGLPPGSRLSQVYLVRPNVVTGSPPEVFRVDVPAVLLDSNPATNIVLRPSDQVYVGETRFSTFSRILPAWLGRAYRRVAGLLPDDWWPLTRPLTWGL